MLNYLINNIFFHVFACKTTADCYVTYLFLIYLYITIMIKVIKIILFSRIYYIIKVNFNDLRSSRK